MHAVKQAKRLIASNPHEVDSEVLADLVIALASEQNFELRRLYTLDAERFALAIGILAEWREADRQASKGKLLDLSLHLKALVGQTDRQRSHETTQCNRTSSTGTR